MVFQMSSHICIHPEIPPALSGMTIQADIDEEQQRFKDFIFSAERGRKNTQPPFCVWK